MPITWGVQPNWTRFNYAKVVAPTGSPTYVVVIRRLDTPTAEQDIYAFGSGAAVAGWRVYSSIDTAWVVNATPAAANTWVYIGGSRDANAAGVDEIARASTNVAQHPPNPFSPVPSTVVSNNAMQDFAASDTTLAFDVEPAGKIGRVSASAPATFIFSDGGTGLINPLVHGDDVFAKSNYGNAGWAEELVIAADGTVNVFRAKANVQVDNFACDGANLYWTEGFGGAPGDDNQPTQEVWEAPYSSDPAILKNTAKKIADISGGAAIYAVAFNGYYAVRSGKDTAWVIRASDGAKQQMNAGPGRWYGTLAYVSASELWAIMTSTSNVSGVAFQRQQLAPWP